MTAPADLAATFEAVLTDHREFGLFGGAFGCKCGQEFADTRDRRAHVASALAAAVAEGESGGDDVPRCSRCGHMPHKQPCLNMASDNDCDCPGEPAEAQADEREALARIFYGGSDEVWAEFRDQRDSGHAWRAADAVLAAGFRRSPGPDRAAWEREVLAQLLVTTAEATSNEIPDFLQAASAAIIRARTAPLPEWAEPESGPEAEAWDQGWEARAEYEHRRDVPTDWPDRNPYRAGDAEGSGR